MKLLPRGSKDNQCSKNGKSRCFSGFFLCELQEGMINN
ncbi:hypothetical protein HMPREF9413_4297 [Paenibacillus sp. HGF7]|nr:hypothetical protein HMPREF9413_4297 [Paenibacillus sp. HGF7]